VSWYYVPAVWHPAPNTENRTFSGQSPRPAQIGTFAVCRAVDDDRVVLSTSSADDFDRMALEFDRAVAAAWR
jgi:hypothetical protein